MFKLVSNPVVRPTTVVRRTTVVRPTRALERETLAAERLARLERLRSEGRLFEFDYAYKVEERPWQRSQAMQRLYSMLQASEQGAVSLLRQFTSYMPWFLRIPVAARPDTPPDEPCWVNGWLPGLDAVTIYGLLAAKNPRYFVEVGSGNSTKFARRAIRDHGLRTKIVSIDPEPRAEIDALCDHVERHRLEDVDFAHFTELSSEDVLFVDCSHRSFQGSDVTVFFTEMLPMLPRGLVYGIHDIWLPQDYPPQWRDRYYNEQYVLTAYLFGGADGDQILCPNGFLSFYSKEAISLFDELWKSPAHEGIEPGGGAFWMQRGG